MSAAPISQVTRMEDTRRLVGYNVHKLILNSNLSEIWRLHAHLYKTVKSN